MYRLLLVGIIVCLFFGTHYSTHASEVEVDTTASPYFPNVWDYRVMQNAEKRLQPIIDEGNKELLIRMISFLDGGLRRLKDPKSQYVLFQLKQIINDAFDQAVRVAAEQSLPGSNSSGEETIPPSTESQPSTDTATIPVSWKTFYETHHDKLTNPDTVLPQCLTYYDEIDTVAKQEDFPTPLIIAMRYKEHTCNLDNPTNGRGNFQITSAYYEPGEITLNDFLQQVRDYIAFSRNKRKRYDRLQKFDEIPVTLTYDQIDLLSIQKHAILYNGLYAGTTPWNSSYANDFFGTGGTSRDGIVAYTLKVIGTQLSNE